MSRTYSVLWIFAFIGFIDETYLELTRLKFSAARGWSLITRLASRISFEVSAPRNGVNKTFVTGQNDIIGKQIFWAVIRSHDVMARFKNNSFKNDPTVSAEYVKFFIMNTGMDVVDQSSKKLTVVEDKVNPMVKEVKVAEAKASNAANNISMLSKTVDGLARKVATLESKK
jgi:hypothetical protein